MFTTQLQLNNKLVLLNVIGSDHFHHGDFIHFYLTLYLFYNIYNRI